jgi:hypothetical protein
LVGAINEVNVHADTAQNNIDAEATARANADTTLQGNIDAEATARANAIDAEATARQTADNTLQGNINSEASTRASADSNLQSQINQIVAPSGEAPSAAEVQNARIGADGITYPTLGDAIRTQNANLKSALKTSEDILRTGEGRFFPNEWLNGYINGANGDYVISTPANANRCIHPTFMPKGTVIKSTYPNNSLRVYSYSNESTFEGWCATLNTNVEYVTTKDGYIGLNQQIANADAVESFNTNTFVFIFFPLYYEIDKVKNEVDGIIDQTNIAKLVKWNYGYISGDGGSIVHGNFSSLNRYSDPIQLHKGAVIKTTYDKNLHIYRFVNNSYTLLDIIKDGFTYTLYSDTVIVLNQLLNENDAAISFNPSNYMEIFDSNWIKTETSSIKETISAFDYENTNGISLPWNGGYVNGATGQFIPANYDSPHRCVYRVFLKAGTVIKNVYDNGLRIYEYLQNGTFVGQVDLIFLQKPIHTIEHDGYYALTLQVNNADNSVAFDPTEYVSVIPPKVGYWAGKKIVWFGTSIPAGVIQAGASEGINSYPAQIGNLLGAVVYNEALGSSAARIGMHGSITQSDPNGYAGVPATCALYSLAMTRSEKQAILDDWDYWKTVFTKGVSEIDPTQPDQYLNSSYETKLDKYLAGGSVGAADFYVFDHGYNDGGNGNGSDYSDTMDVPTNSKDRTYFIGAMDFLIDRILTSNRKAQIIIVAHYNDEGAFSPLVEAQRYIANKWNLPFVETYKNMGFTTSASITIDGTTKTMKDWWLPDGIHPASDPTGAALKHYAEVLYPMIRDLR